MSDNPHNNVGERIKNLRTGNNMTLKDLSEITGFSIGFLSQLERGLTTIAIESLEKIAKALNVDITYFFARAKNKDKLVLKSYERELYQVINNNIVYHLTNDIENRDILPRLIEILPSKEKEEVDCYTHKGEEFIYVLEGVLTLVMENESIDLYPGDSAHYKSLENHNWGNYTNQVVKFLAVNSPNGFKKED